MRHPLIRYTALLLALMLLCAAPAQALPRPPVNYAVMKPKATVDAFSLDRKTATITLGNPASPTKPLTLTPVVQPASATVGKITWTSSSACVTVSEDGEITALKKGKAIVRATHQDTGKSAACTITVKANPVKSVTLSKKSAIMDMKETLSLSATVKPAAATFAEVTWSAADPTILEVSQNGTVKPLKPGTTKVVAKAGGVKGVCTVRVLKGNAVDVTISAAGDVVFGGDPRPKAQFYHRYAAFYDMVYGAAGGRKASNPVFGNVAEYFENDDATFVNLETTLSSRRSGIKSSRSIVLFGEKRDAELLKKGSVEVVTITNNHAQNAGLSSKRDTIAALNQYGIKYTDTEQVATMKTKDGVKIGFVSFFYYYAGLPTDQLTATIKRLKRSQDIVVVYYHWGFAKQFVYSPVARNMKRQTQITRAAVDAGADLVLGSHTHRYNGIEQYKNKYIVYDLGNFVFSARDDIADKRTYIFQQTFRFYPESDYLAPAKSDQTDVRIIPCLISSDGVWDDPTVNDAYPTPLKGAERAALIEHVNSLSAQFKYGVQLKP